MLSPPHTQSPNVWELLLYKPQCTYAHAVPLGARCCYRLKKECQPKDHDV